MDLAKPNESQKSSTHKTNRNKTSARDCTRTIKSNWNDYKRKCILKLEQHLNGNQMTWEKTSQQMTHKNIPWKGKLTEKQRNIQIIWILLVQDLVQQKVSCGLSSLRHRRELPTLLAAQLTPLGWKLLGRWRACVCVSNVELPKT